MALIPLSRPAPDPHTQAEVPYPGGQWVPGAGAAPIPLAAGDRPWSLASTFWGVPSGSTRPHTTLASSLLCPGGPLAGNEASLGCWKLKKCILPLAACEPWSVREHNPPAPADGEVIHQPQEKAFLVSNPGGSSEARLQHDNNTKQTVNQF